MSFRVYSKLPIWRSNCQSLHLGGVQRSAYAVPATARPSSEIIPNIILENNLADCSSKTRQINEQAPYMVKTYVRPSPVFVKGKGCYLWDSLGKKYLDFTAGIAVNALGHCDSQIAETLLHTSNLYHNTWTGALSQILVQTTIKTGAMHDCESVFICNSGAEANEAAIKFARKSGKIIDPSGEKYQLVSFHNSFHGRTMGALSATPNPKYQKPFSPMIPGFNYGVYNDVTSINELVTQKTCGVIVEPIQGEGGVIVGTDEFLTALASRCQEVGAVLIYDEIQCGLSRTGNFWAHSTLPKSAHPDIITTAKALGNGFPIGATIVNKSVSEKIMVGDHGTTFGGNPLGSRIAHHIVGRLSDPKFLADVAEKSKIFRENLQNLQNKHTDLIQEIRGKGLILGLQLSRDPNPIITAALEKGLLIITAGTNTIRIVPSLTVTKQEIIRGVQILDEAIEAIDVPSQKADSM
ncbi:hypothetical protein Golomagni_02120 [Golovinomyces magnicellulatus]|nr:hypothetical protein Golomagni_02120 [Golovinomyces magnicellulatus]